MSRTLTVRNVPPALHARLVAAAVANRRSLSDEAIACLQKALPPSRLAVADRLQQIRLLRSQLPWDPLQARHVESFKRQGRR
ncbi:MAG: plasmid stability protein [Gammaproteobacteria bacterium]|nr:plasmid stability protein [Gammaproteobacteria bacterium]